MCVYAVRVCVFFCNVKTVIDSATVDWDSYVCYSDLVKIELNILCSFFFFIKSRKSVRDCQFVWVIGEIRQVIEEIRHLALSAELVMIMAKVDLRLRWVVLRHFSSYVVKFLKSELEISSVIHELHLSVILSSQ